MTNPFEERQSSRGMHASWTALDVVAQDALEGRCIVEAKADAADLGINDASLEMISSFLRAANVRGAAADSLASAIVDWRDADSDPLPLGAERLWYGAQGRSAPGNARIRSMDEMSRVRGVDGSASWLSMIRFDSVAVSVNHAPEAVLRSLPGITASSARAILTARGRGVFIRDLTDLMNLLSLTERESLAEASADFLAAASFDTPAWTVRLTLPGDALPAYSAGIKLEVRGGVVFAVQWDPVTP